MESNLVASYGRFYRILWNYFITTGSGGTAPLKERIHLSTMDLNPNGLKITYILKRPFGILLHFISGHIQEVL